MKSHFYFGSRRINYALKHSDRRTLGITVTPELDVLVMAPEGAELDEVKKRLRKRAPWIIKQQGFFLSFEPRTPPRRFVSGETHLYLGRQYRLDVTHGNEESVKLAGGRLVVTTADKSTARKLVKNWYLHRASIRFGQLASPLVDRFKQYEVEPSGIVLRDMTRRWGSCTPAGKIILNPGLIKAPTGCIEYVITHELCHLIHHDHTSKFIELQSREMPQWEKWKRKLETLLA